VARYFLYAERFADPLVVFHMPVACTVLCVVVVVTGRRSSVVAHIPLYVIFWRILVAEIERC
jgi:hypothetical protein